VTENVTLSTCCPTTEKASSNVYSVPSVLSKSESVRCVHSVVPAVGAPVGLSMQDTSTSQGRTNLYVQVPSVGSVEHVLRMMVGSLMMSSEYAIIATDVMSSEHVAVIGPIVKPSLTDPYVLQEGSQLESVYATWTESIVDVASQVSAISKVTDDPSIITTEMEFISYMEMSSFQSNALHRFGAC
jgi:hypothetical protein